MAINSVHFIGIPPKLKKELRSIVLSALRDARKALRYREPIGVAVFEAPADLVIPEIGLAGSAIGKTGIEIKIDLSRKLSKRKFELELYSSVCHETAHLARENAVGYNSSLLDAMVNEGVACFTEKTLKPERSIPYIAPIKNEKRALRSAASHFFEKNYDHSKWFFGAKNFPKWAGYRIGYLIVDGYAKNNRTTLPNLAKMESVKIFRGSKIRWPTP